MSEDPRMTIWGYLLHLSYNMWEDVADLEQPRTLRDSLQCDDALWAELTRTMADSGLNLIVIDLGDGVRYEPPVALLSEASWHFPWCVRLGKCQLIT